MKLLFKQRFFSWLDSYDIFDETGRTVYTVKGELAWGHRLKIYDRHDREVGTVQQRVLTFLPKFEMYQGERYIGCICKELSLFTPRFSIDYNGWQVEGDWAEWDYSILDAAGRCIATVNKQPFNWTDTYTMDIHDPQNALYVLMLVLAIDAEKCSRDN